MRINQVIGGVTRRMLQAFGSTFGGKRDLYEIFGYKQKIELDDYRFRYKRGDIATRLVNAYPDACWSTPPMPTDDEDEQEETDWEKEFKDFAKKIKLWQMVRKADILAQINEYGILFFGVASGGELKDPVTGNAEVKYLRAFGSDSAKIDTWVEDENDERFGLPETYKVTVSSGREKGTQKDIVIHHSRCLHIAERTLDDPVYGQPFMESIWNRLDDLEKVAGSSGELWWLNGRAGLNISVDAEADLQPDDKEELKQMAEDYQNKLNRMIRTQGAEVKPLSIEVPSPKEHAELYLSLISGATGVPKRILMGSERGELASSQDENAFDSRIKERRNTFCEPEVLVPLMEKLIGFGAITEPEEMTWNWPDLNTLSEKDKADIIDKKSKAIATYSNAPEADHLVPPQQFVEDILDMEYREDEIDELIEEERKEVEEQQKQFEQDGLPNPNQPPAPGQNQPPNQPAGNQPPQGE